MPRVRACALAVGALAAALLSGACDSQDPTAVETPVPLETLPGATLSNPIPLSAGAAAPSASLGDAQESSVVYLSLVPGTIPDGDAVALTNLTSGATVNAVLNNGGLDPVPLAAAEGDDIEIAVKHSGDIIRRFLSKVIRRRRPSVVRAEPPSGKRDVPLYAVVTVVFSEPLHPQSLSDGGVSVRVGGVSVSGSLAFENDQRMRAVFTSESELLPSTEHEIVVSANNRDLDGDLLESEVVSSFTTAANNAALATVSGVLLFDGLPGILGSFVSVRRQPPGAIATSAMSWFNSAFFSFERMEPGTYEISASTGGVGHSGNGICQKQTLTLVGGRAYNIQLDCSFAVGSIRVANADGSGEQLLTMGNRPRWSPDGTRIVFDRSMSIYVANADGSNAVRVARGFQPAWSPDGSRIAYANGDGIFTMNPDGTGGVQLFRRTPWGYDMFPTVFAPDWSPDGKFIAFDKTDILGDFDWPNHVRVLEVATHISTGISSAEAQQYSYPAWAPDGTLSVTVGGFDNSPGTSGLGLIANVQNPLLQMIFTNEPGDGGISSYVSSRADWSRDSQRLLVGLARYSQGTWDYSIWLLSRSGGQPQRVVQNAYDPAWSPDGTRILFWRYP